jgi:multidrug resistance efflux pump
MGATMSVVITGLFPGKGRIESIMGGISAANAASSTLGLPNVDPIFTWVRLAQRIPVRVRI